MIAEYRGFTIETKFKGSDGWAATVTSDGNVVQAFLPRPAPTSSKAEGEDICIRRAKTAIDKLLAR